MGEKEQSLTKGSPSRRVAFGASTNETKAEIVWCWNLYCMPPAQAGREERAGALAGEQDRLSPP
jgi:hypothetical protein